MSSRAHKWLTTAPSASFITTETLAALRLTTRHASSFSVTTSLWVSRPTFFICLSDLLLFLQPIFQMHLLRFFVCNSTFRALPCSIAKMAVSTSLSGGRLRPVLSGSLGVTAWTLMRCSKTFCEKEAKFLKYHPHCSSQVRTVVFVTLKVATSLTSAPWRTKVTLLLVTNTRTICLCARLCRQTSAPTKAPNLCRPARQTDQNTRSLVWN